MEYISIDNFGFRKQGAVAIVNKIQNGLVYFNWKDEYTNALLYSGENKCGEDIFNKKFIKLTLPSKHIN